MRVKQWIMTVAALALLTQSASARVWVFGDSNLDTGWYETKPFSGNPKFDADLAMSQTFGIGKPTNNPGPMSVEVLAQLLLSSARPANQIDGTNFATSGAKNVNVNTPLNGGFPNAIPTATQISTFVATHPVGTLLAAANDLYVIDSGFNDITFALSNLSGFTPDQVNAYLTDQAKQLAVAIKGLQLNGGTHFIVLGQGESFGDATTQAARLFYDTALRNALAVQKVSYAWGDKNQVRKDIVNNPGTFGITAVKDTIFGCPQPNPVLNITTAWALLCSANSPVTQPTATADQTLFADDSHWTAAGQKVLGSYLFCLTRVTWPTFGLPVPRPLSASLTLPLGKPPFACKDFTEFKNVALPPGLQ